MESTKLSSKGQIVIPKEIRDFYDWKPGLEFVVIDSGGSLIIKPKGSFPETTLAEVAGSLPYYGPKRTLKDMENAIQKGVEQEYGRR